jgi:serine/threonine protein kinase
MLDESVFDDIHEIQENQYYLDEIQKNDVRLEMLQDIPAYDQCGELEKKLETEGALTFDWIFNSPTGYYMIKCFLIADYAVDKAIFIKDVEAYRGMRFESARRKVAKLLFQRFVASEPEHSLTFDKGSSVFEIINQFPDLNGAGMGSSENINLQSTNSTTNHKSVLDSSAETPEGGVDKPKQSILLIGTDNNPIGVYGAAVKKVRETVNQGLAPKDLFDKVAQQVMLDLRLDVFPRFKTSTFYQKYIRIQHIHNTKVTIKDFQTFRLLGRGGFGAVYACRKKNSGTIYAMKQINKKLVKVKNALDNVLEERNVLTMLKSAFVTNLKYALHDNEMLYLIMDLMSGGDLKFQLIVARMFSEKRARFYAAEVLLGLEALHNASIIYRDMKLENVLLDHEGHCRISDLGLAVVTKVKIKGYAGTPGYTAPEMIKNKLYGPGADIFSYGVMLYRMLCGQKPFKGKAERELDQAVQEKKPTFHSEVFSKDAISLLTGLLQKRPEHRLGCGSRGIQEIKEHSFFESIDWGLLEAGYIDPPFVPNRDEVNTQSLRDIGEFDINKYQKVALDKDFLDKIKNFEFISSHGLQDEMVSVLEKADQHVNFEKFSPQPDQPATQLDGSNAPCCSII